MTQQQVQQQTQENSPLDLKETESKNIEDTNKKDTEKDESKGNKKKIAVHVYSFNEEMPEDKSEGLLFRAYKSKWIEKICKSLSLSISKKFPENTWLVIFFTAYLSFGMFELFWPVPFSVKVSNSVTIIKTIMILFITILTFFATARTKRRYQIFGFLIGLSIFLPIVSIIYHFLMSRLLNNPFELFLVIRKSIDAVLMILGFVSSMGALYDYYELDKSEVFTSEKKYEDDEMDALKDELNEYLTNREKSNNKS